ncbi:MAG TPA: rod shape-determining protein MreD [Acidimicrobiales bacterium]
MLSGLFESPWIRLPLVLIAVLTVQTALVPELRPFGVAPDLMLLFAVASGLVGGPQVGALVGFVCGVLFDLMLNTPFGLSALVYGLAAYSAGYVQLQVAKAGWWIPMAAVGAASALAMVGFALIGSLFGVERLVNGHLLWIAFVVGGINALLAPVAIRIERWALEGRDRARR